MDEPRDLRYGSWNRRAARFVLRPLLGTFVVPNHITALRWLTGIAACLLFARGDYLGGGLLWVISTFLDRCDGEYARMSGLISRTGYLFDLIGDIFFNAVVFVGLGFGLANNATTPILQIFTEGQWIAVGCFVAASIMAAGILAEFNETGMKQGEKTFDGRWGFDFDDFIYLIGVIPMVGGGDLLMVGAMVGGPLAAIVVAVKLARKRSHALPR